jgi:high-affinity iron transporter
MSSSFFLAFREGLEAALVIGIILAQLVKINRKELSKYVYTGVICGCIVCAVGGYIVFSSFKETEESSEVFLEGYMRVIASGLIAYFILWLHRNSSVTRTIQSKVSNNASIMGLIILAFLSVFREGLELVVFNLSQISQDASTVVMGSVIGIIVAIAVAYIIIKTTVKLNLGFIFKILGIVLIYLGGELFAEGLVKIFGGGESLETGALILFIVPSLYIFLKKEILNRLSRREA